jgi:uncharacterized protein (DUF1501 family)
MSAPTIHSRRRFLKGAGAVSAISLASSLDSFGVSAVSAQGAPGYKALVCVFLFGGADSNNFVIPNTGPAGQDYAAYNAVRDPSSGINIAQASLVPISPSNTPGRTFGLHPSMAALGSLFSAGKAAVVCNVGTLLYPTTRAQYLARQVQSPSQLFSHSDQQQQFMSDISAPTLVGITGWGGRLAEKVAGLNAPNATPMAMSFSGSQTFGNGATTRMLAMPTARVGANFGFSGDSATPSAAQIARSAARTAITTALDANQVVQAGQDTASSAIRASGLLNPILNSAVPSYIASAFTGLTTSIANQLKSVAMMIDQRATLGHSRQIFFVSIGGWDTHTGQGSTAGGLVNLLNALVPALNAFYVSTVNMSVANEVTTFTMSDFSRTWKPNSGGTDHAWGGHHFVIGGSVVGNKFYGAFPDLKLGAASANDSGSQGRWIPTTALDQYGATLAKWFGASPADVAQIFPNLGRFATADVGFMA